MRFFNDLFKVVSPAYAVGSFLNGNKNDAKNAANQAAEASAHYANTGANAQRENITQGYSAAQGRLDPYAKQAQAGFNDYADSIGVNGDAGYKTAFAKFNNDPFRAGQSDATSRAIQSMFRRYNRTGQTGTQMTAVGRVGSDIYGQQVADYRNRLMGMGGQGVQIAGQQAGWDISKGQEIGNSHLQQQNTLGSIENNRIAGNQAANNQFMNSILGLGGTVLGMAAAPFTGGASLGMSANSMRGMGSQGQSQNRLMQGMGYMG